MISILFHKTIENVARGKVATQSGSYYTFSTADKALDGNNNPSMHHGSCAHPGMVHINKYVGWNLGIFLKNALNTRFCLRKNNFSVGLVPSAHWTVFMVFLTWGMALVFLPGGGGSHHPLWSHHPPSHTPWSPTGHTPSQSHHPSVTLPQTE